MKLKRETEFIILIVLSSILVIMLLIGQTLAWIEYEFTVSIGLQESVKDIGQLGVAINKAFGVGDTFTYLPLLIFGLLGIWLNKSWGYFCMVGALGITIYWPIVNVFIIIFAERIPEFNYPNFIPTVVILILITIYGLWGLRYLYINRKHFDYK